MRLRRIVVSLLLFGLAWPVAAQSLDCSCQRKKPAAHACCPGSKPKPAEKNSKKDCCTIAPEDRSRSEAVETARPVPPSGSNGAPPPALQIHPAFATQSVERFGAACGGDPPGEPPRIHLSNCTFRI